MTGSAERLFLAVSGGNVTTDALLVTNDGRVLARVHGGQMSPQRIGFDATVAAIDELQRRSIAAAGLSPDTPIARIGAFMAGIDLPVERQLLWSKLAARFPGLSIVVENDIHAVLWAGLRRPAGAAVICDDGINAIARSATGKTAGYLAFGTISGEWGGGLTLGREVLYAASRAEDGRGPPTSLQYHVAAHFARPTVRDAVVDLRIGTEPEVAVVALVPVLFEADKGGDEVAGRLVERLAEEVVLMARAAMSRALVPQTGSDIVLAGSVLTAGYDRLDRLVDLGFGRVLPGAAVSRLALPIVVGAALGCIGTERRGRATSDRLAGAIVESLSGLSDDCPSLPV